MARKKKKQDDSSIGGCPAWLAQYGDMVTLVLTFFVLLFSFSSIDVEKWKMVATALSGMPSVFDGTYYRQNPEQWIPSGIPDLDVDDLEKMPSEEQWEYLSEMIEQLVESGQFASMAAVESTDTEIRITLSGDALFDSGRADLRPGSADVLLEVMEQFVNHEEITLPLVGKFVIEGHTDNVPQNSAQFRNNWLLSSGRAYTVFAFLLENFPEDEYPDLPFSMYDFSGRGEYHPVATNDTPEGRQLNRRVEFYIMRDMSDEQIINYESDWP